MVRPSAEIAPIPLTARQAQILELIRQYITDTGYPPTRADIAKELGFKSANAAEEHLKALARKGAIEMIPGTSRGIRLPEPLIALIYRLVSSNPMPITCFESVATVW